jgi:hypothetical protein
MHVLHDVRERDFRGNLPQLWGQSGCSPDPACSPSSESAGFNQTGSQGRRLREGHRLRKYGSVRLGARVMRRKLLPYRGRLNAIGVIAVMVVVLRHYTPALLDSGVTRLAIALVAVGFTLFVYWVGVLYDRNRE